MTSVLELRCHVSPFVYPTAGDGTWISTRPTEGTEPVQSIFLVHTTFGDAFEVTERSGRRLWVPMSNVACYVSEEPAAADRTDASGKARLIRDAILQDATDRRGWRQEWNMFDPDVKEELKGTWLRMIEEVLAR